MEARHAVLICAGVLLVASSAAAKPAPLAQLMAAEPTEGGLSVTVPTGGCTDKEDFTASAKRGADGTASVEIRRLKPDDCKGNFPKGLKLLFSWTDLNLPAGTKLNVTNAIVPHASPGYVSGETVIKKTVAIKHKPVHKCHKRTKRSHHCAVHRGKRKVHHLKPKRRSYHAYRHRHRHWHPRPRRDWCLF